MQNMRPFKSVCPLRNELHLDITTAVKVTAKGRDWNQSPLRNLERLFLSSFLQKGSAEWYEGLIARYKPEEGVSVRSFTGVTPMPV